MTDKEIDELAERLSGTWNYRLILMDESSQDEPWYEVHEVHYDTEGKPLLWTQNASKVNGESPQAVLHDLLLMAIDANRHPILKESKMPKNSEDRTNKSEAKTKL
jgi:hypothetical protein